MTTVPPALQQLAQRLRDLREKHWPDRRLTQAALALALAEGDNDHLATATVSSWESTSAPKLPPRNRLVGYARFFATRRSLEGGAPHLVPRDSLSDDERAACKALEDELLALRDAAARTEAARSWKFSDKGPLTIVCAELPVGQVGPLADPADPNYIELQSFADSDALVELHGHVRAENPDMEVFFKASPNVVPDDLSGHLVLLGGVVWNEITESLYERTPLPVKQIEDADVETGEVFVADLDGKEQKFMPKWRDNAHRDLAEDVGLFARMPNPVNSNRTLTICNGVHSRGVLGAVRSLTDARLRTSNEAYIVRNFRGSLSYAVLLRVPIIGGQTMTPDFNAPGFVRYRWSRDNGE